jgi:hypothetical protein
MRMVGMTVFARVMSVITIFFMFSFAIQGVFAMNLFSPEKTLGRKPPVSEEQYKNLSLLEKVKILEEMAGYSSPHWVEEGIIQHGKEAVPYMVEFLSEGKRNRMRADVDWEAIYILTQIHSRGIYNLRSYSKFESLKRVLEDAVSRKERAIISQDAQELLNLLQQ